MKLTKEDAERLLSWRVAANADGGPDVELMTRLKEHIADLAVGLLAVTGRWIVTTWRRPKGEVGTHIDLA